ncbi:nucleoside triphosphate pyrophosphohydrolase [Paenibacillus koleovorans]|uniref:nucleoside triphosphate pyrophosphohydrolase n=1 Tax=Paenibacillus koleovorans TaxID=121608 RepID=UPI000FD74353|nr:nucleoside triphosphate pyrophosphohydrolase [Paenibacillus koleovorans]
MPASIVIVGLGSGDENQLTLGVWKRLQAARTLYLRTAHHPVTAWMESQGLTYRSFDFLYEQFDSFQDVYEQIAIQLVRHALEEGSEIVYAVPGHPMVAESTTRLLRIACEARGIPLEIIGGESFLDQAFLRLGFDPIDGFALLDATNLTHHRPDPRIHTLIGQVYDTFTASEVKLQLMSVYPDDYEVVVGHHLGVYGEESIAQVPLYELDRIEGYGNLSLIWVPASGDDQLRSRSFERLHEIVAILRSPEGCPWDREQTHASIRKNLIEETYEVLETIDDDDPDAMCEEMGDLLLQILLHAQMEEEAGAFDVFDVLETLHDKLIRRHPHVFGEKAAADAEEALQNWNAIKLEEKRSRGIEPGRQSQLAGVPRDLPGLMKAYKLQKKAAQVGFDWDKIDDVYAKIEEELRELKEASDEGREGELGDLLFAVVNLSRFLKIDPEEALATTNRKFVDRFGYIEQELRAAGRDITQSTLAEMEVLWQKSKKLS